MVGDEDEPRIGEAMRRMGAEPLLAVEKRLIVWSLIFGVVLLAIPIWTGNASRRVDR